MISVVLLLRAPMRLTEDRIRKAIVQAWGRDLRQTENEYVVLKSPVCFVRFDSIILLINNVARPYVSEEYRRTQASAEFKELRQLKVVMEHHAFFTVDLMHPQKPDDKTKRNAYRQMCSFAAEFVNDNCQGVSFPETGWLRPYDDDVMNALKSEDPVRAISQVSEPAVISVQTDNNELQAAALEALRRWPEFLAAFQSRRTDQMFSVKAPFRDGENVEWIWVTPSFIAEDTVEGALDNAPVNIKNVSAGELVRIPIERIADWLYTDGEIVIGGFSLEVLRRSR